MKKQKTQEEKDAYNLYQKNYRKAHITRHEIVKETYDALPSDAVEIPTFPSYYATPDGEIWRIAEPRTNKITTIASRIIKITQRKNSHVPYNQVQPYQQGIKKLVYVHRLVLLAFKGIPEYGKDQCNHINGDTFDNRASNLEWCTRLENQNRRVNPRNKFGHLKQQCLDDFDAGMKIADIIKKYDMRSSHSIYGWLIIRKNNQNNLEKT